MAANTASSMNASQPLALVTGAAGAIGGAIVSRLLATGHRVLAVDHDASGLAAFCAAQQTLLVTPLDFDLSNAADTPAFLSDVINTHGPITRLVLNAGVWPGARIVDMPDDVWQVSFAVNVTSPFLFLRGLVPAMAAAGGGAVVCTASRNAHRSSTGNAAYDASKAALLGLVRTAAGEFASDHIRVNAISAGPIKTLAASGVSGFKSMHRQFTEITPMKVEVTIEDVGNTAVYLCSDLSAKTTGQTTFVDSGYNILGVLEPADCD